MSTQLKLIGPELLVLFSLHVLMINNGRNAAQCSSQELILRFVAHVVIGTVFPTLLCSLQDHNTYKSFVRCMEAANGPDWTAEDSTLKQSASNPSCMEPPINKGLLSDSSNAASHPSSMQHVCDRTAASIQSAPKLLHPGASSSGKEVRIGNMLLDGMTRGHKLGAAKPTSSFQNPSAKVPAAHAPSCMYRSKARMRLVSVKVSSAFPLLAVLTELCGYLVVSHFRNSGIS
jgi:hypothetical protein